jgi:ornithine carbamoyltransferase
MNKDFLSVADLDRREAEHLIEQAYRMKREGTPTLLAGRTLALLFEKPSLRTKVSFDGYASTGRTQHLPVS